MSNRQVWTIYIFIENLSNLKVRCQNDNPTCYCSSLKSWIRIYFLELGLALLDNLAMKLTFKAGFVPSLVVIQLFQWLMVNVYWKCISLSKIYHSKSLNILIFSLSCSKKKITIIGWSQSVDYHFLYWANFWYRMKVCQGTLS